MNRPPNSKSNLERAISRYAGNDAVRANELAVAFSNAIVAQLIGAGVVKGGSSLKLRYGDKATRVTKDLDTAWSVDLDSFLKDVGGKLKSGWNGFSGEIVVLKQASPRGIPFEYVMQPCAVHLSYLGTPWRIVDMEIGHNEIGDADAFDLIPAPSEIALLAEHLCFPALGEVRVMKLEYQIAQKLHGATERDSKRAHDLIDLQLIFAKNEIDMAVNSVLTGDYSVEQRTLLELVSPEKVFEDVKYALNELNVIRNPEHSLLAIKVFVDDVYLNTYWGDGILLATPTGSTAYSLSAGGPIIAPNAKNFVITPIATHNLTVRPVVIPDDSTIRIQVEGREKKFVFSMDSRSCTLDTSVQLEVRKAGFCLNLVRMRGEDFFGTIRNKLMWGKDNRN